MPSLGKFSYMRRIAMRWTRLGFLGRAMNLKRTISELSLMSTTPCIRSELNAELGQVFVHAADRHALDQAGVLGPGHELEAHDQRAVLDVDHALHQIGTECRAWASFRTCGGSPCAGPGWGSWAGP